MELLELAPFDYSVRAAGIYIIDDDGIRVLAGPFTSDTAAIAWIVQRHDMLNGGPMVPTARSALTVQAVLA